MKMKLRLLAGLIVALLLCTFCSLDGDLRPTVSFNSNGGSSVPGTSVLSGGTISRPADPTKTAYIFVGWYRDAGFNVMFDFSTAITEDTTLYAKWELDPNMDRNNIFLVTFDCDDFDSIESQYINKGDKVSRPADPGRSGHVFAGWYTDWETTNVYDFSAPVTADMRLYAKWAWDGVTYYTVTFNASGGTGTLPATQKVKPGDRIWLPKPSDCGLEKSGYTLMDLWLSPASDRLLTGGFYFIPESDITFYAYWLDF